MLRRVRLIACLWAFLLPAIASPAVLVVAPNQGPGVHFTSLQAAVDAAMDGDTILVQSGSYSQPLANDPFSMVITGKSLSVVADVGATVELTGQIRITSLASGQRVVIRGIDVTGSSKNFDQHAVECADNEGAIWIEDGLFRATPGTFLLTAEPPIGARFTNCTDVTLVRCELDADGKIPAVGCCTHRGLGHGLVALGSEVRLYSCILRGGASDVWDQPSRNGAIVVGGSLVASDCQFFGGDGGPAIYSPLSGGCTNLATGGHGLVLSDTFVYVNVFDFPTNPFVFKEFISGPPRVDLFECEFLGGTPGFFQSSPLDPPGTQCAPPPGGTQIQPLAGTLIQHSLVSRSLTASSPVTAGQTGSLTFRGQPGDQVLFTFSVGADPLFSPTYGPPLIVQLPASFIPFGMIPASGELSFTLPVFPGAGLPKAIQIFEQAVFIDPNGQGVIGAPSTVTWLNPPF